ncbi:electron transfer flavoprotein subunit alpha/FixB family protein [Mucilaginibacter phyllosphaerae]|uniref:Electron transfer flavoprotein alpha subunit n=1 Tax=Mucilaginibacter phyllosphaerae TaxID=1812349 RepID=A0A4Y8A663_9SPHI|nr:electron transfer flavoprotein subunit alpha/FixB family protein [Mucilaginibacter phyllosphaerae]MBB3971130.1 electron transfer flavoprotein alpha subunit [Mucilaginibacter phyllosphaerae]TEW63860.1 electron transfer flavoprotein subunit alpha/FixB family protein [Mucilaginibacter phyllosphaerae]GGH22651.1 electron transfer flavoprotein subunit alpha [Mucilaginibacter phyllosphaerae]
MSVIVLVEHTEGTIKKKSLEAVQYAADIAKKLGTTATAIVAGNVAESEMQNLGNYGAAKVLYIGDNRLNQLHARAFTRILVTAARQEGSPVIVALHDVNGRAIAPRVAVQLKAGLVSGALSSPDMSDGFVVKKSAFSGKAFAFVNVTSQVKVVMLAPNSFPLVKGEGSAVIENLTVAFDEKDFGVTVQSVDQITGEIPLSDAELVVSGGRGMKGPENWGLIEGLAKELGAATACSRPVADAHWRPHHEHVGQTGGTVRPNLYIAAGISGAIQHLAGVSGSKTIVVINKDPEAPFFKAANYGVVGDVMEVLPRLTEAVKKFKAQQH